jgi:hypothetical protein
VPWIAFAASGTRYQRASIAHKSCSRGPVIVTAGLRFRFRFIDAAGRVSRPSARTRVALDRHLPAP